MPAPLTLLPYLQRWNGNAVAVRVVVAPHGSPLDPLVAGGPSFTDANLVLDVRLVQGLGALPTLGDPFTSLVVASPAVANATAIGEALERSLPIDPTVPPVDARATGARFMKYAPPLYRQATGLSGSSSPYIVTGDEYRCAREGVIASGTQLKSDPPKVTWGKVMALALRQPLLSEAVGLVRPLELEPPADFFAEGGWIYVTLHSTSDASGLIGTPGALRLFAARVPPLSDPRSLFTSVLFPVAASVPSASYDSLFQEVLDYDDGFAKAVYGTQPQRVDPLGEDDDGTRPAADGGIQLGWDDEQVAQWLNRPVDPALAAQNAPTGVLGYRVDARLVGDTAWSSLVRGETALALDGLDLGSRAAEFHVEIAPNKLMGDTSGTFWMPTYFTTWKGPSLVGPDKTELELQGRPTAATVVGTAPTVVPRYGKSYEFRVRLVDHAGGGPTVEEAPRNPSVQPIATVDVRRWVRPQAVRMVSDHPVVADPANAPTRIEMLRPRLGYPAAVFAGGTTAALIADLPLAVAERRGAGIPDPDVVAAEIAIDVEHPTADGGYRRLYTTRRSFPTAADQSLSVELDWRDVRDASTLAATTTGAIPVPTSRNVRISVVALGRDDANYFGAEDARRGPVSYIAVRRAASDERILFAPSTVSDAIEAIYLQPEQPTDHTVLIAQQSAGKGLQAPDNALGRLAVELDLEVAGSGLRGKTGARVLFGCSPRVRNIIGPDGASIAFGSVGDLTQIWLVALRVDMDRDWSWDGLEHLRVERNGVLVGRLESRRSVGQEARSAQGTERSRIIFIDAFDPKPPAGQFPRESDLAYKLVPVFRTAPTQSDPVGELAIRLPVTTPPTQIPRLVSAGIALSPYTRSDDYSRTEVRHRALWLEFESPPDDSRDGMFARILARAPDPVLLRDTLDVAESAEPPLPIDPEPIRTVVPGQGDDKSGLGAMQTLVPTDSPRHFVLPLPPGASEDSHDLFGFFTYELRLGHKEGWSTAQGRFGRPLRVTGVQHPAPSLACQVTRTRVGIEVSAAFADPVLEQRSVRPLPPATQLWVLLYVQVVQADGQDHRNILLDARPAQYQIKKWQEHQIRRPIVDHGTATWSNGEVADLVQLLGASRDATLSCVVVETLPGDQPLASPVTAGLGYERFLRTSPLTPVPEMCV